MVKPAQPPLHAPQNSGAFEGRKHTLEVCPRVPLEILNHPGVCRVRGLCVFGIGRNPRIFHWTVIER